MNVRLAGYVRCSTKEQNPDRQIMHNLSTDMA